MALSAAGTFLMIILATSEGASVPVYTGLIHIVRARGDAGPFLCGAPQPGRPPGRDNEAMTSMRPEEAGRAAPAPIRRLRPPGRRRLVARLWR
ncbi:MAG: hypothetical protein LDL25_04265, partial [Hyphomicrobiales bacterium]|nr:hypothetical protein [Hyphomicrobiales bacterium]